jgi:phosphatidate cytidylyltransferase
VGDFFLITRIVSGLVGMALTVFVVHFGSYVFGAAVFLLALIGWHEFSRAFANRGEKLAYITGMIAIVFLLGCAWLGNAEESVAVITVATLWILMQMIFRHRFFSVEQACLSIAGVMYVGMAFSHLLLLRFTGADAFTALGSMTLPIGEALLWLAFIGTWASDTFAFFTGSFCGRHKLCPEISPNKTIEGFAGGLIGTVGITVLLGYLFSFSLIHMVALGILLALTATLGDLVESSFKRYTGIKDSGALIPGHGGVLDRFDSIMFTVPLVYYYVQIFDILK